MAVAAEWPRSAGWARLAAALLGASLLLRPEAASAAPAPAPTAAAVPELPPPDLCRTAKWAVIATVESSSSRTMQGARGRWGGVVSEVTARFEASLRGKPPATHTWLRAGGAVAGRTQRGDLPLNPGGRYLLVFTDEADGTEARFRILDQHAVALDAQAVLPPAHELSAIWTAWCAGEADAAARVRATLPLLKGAFLPAGSPAATASPPAR